jgi:hypothetical protein
MQELDKIKVTEETKTYEHELTLVFWFATHLENLQIAGSLMTREFLLKQLVACALMNNALPVPKPKGKDSDEDWDDGSQGSNESFQSENLSEEEKAGKNPNMNKKQRTDIQKEGGSDEDSFYDDDDYKDNHGTT